MLRRLAAWFCLLLSPLAHGLDASVPLADLEHTVFQPRDGAPTNINDIQQTPDGLLWLATNSGLFNFDGVRFRRYQTPEGHELPDVDIYSLTSTPAGALWVGTRYGRIYRIERDRFRQFDQASGIPAHTICGIGVDVEGNVWAGSARTGVFRLTGDRWVATTQEDGSPVTPDQPACLTIDRTGNVWATNAGTVFSLARGSARFQPRSRGMRQDRLGVVLDQQGQPWLDSVDGFLSLTAPNAGIGPDVLQAIVKGNEAGIVYFDRAGMVWGVAGDQYYRMTAPSSSHPGILHSPVDLQVLSGISRRNVNRTSYARFIEDQEGNVWAANGGGLERFRATKFHRATSMGTALNDAALTVSPSGSLWVATFEGLFQRGEANTMNQVSAIHGAQELASAPILAPSDGELYAGSFSSLNRWTSAGLVRVPMDFANGPVTPHALAERVPGEIWLSALSTRGVFVRHDGHWTRRDGIGGIPSGPALSMAAEGGRMWLGYPNDTLAIVDAKAVRLLGSADGLGIGNVTAILPQGEHAWIGGSGGLAYFDGASIHAVQDVSLAHLSSVTGLLMTPEGELWLNDDVGVQRVPAGEVTAFARDPRHPVVSEFFDAHSGIEGSPARIQPLPTTGRTPDGLLWFSTSIGLYWIDPRHIARNPVAPQPLVMDVRAHDAFHRGSAVSLPAHTDAFEVDYTAPILGVPELARFRYRLQGVDRDWQDAGGRRQAFYTNLSPGEYRFEVDAANEDGLWSKSPAVVTISIAPTYWQTTWFRVLGTLAAVLLLSVAALSWHRVRLHRLERNLRHEARIQHDERERIARDLHDTLLQNMYAFLWRIDVIGKRLGPGDPNRQALGDALEHADNAVREGRDRVLSLHQSAESCAALTERLVSLGQQWAAVSGTAFEFEVDEAASIARPALPVVRDAFERILSEAITNAFRHAAAKTVRVRLHHGPQALTGEVIDDGTGIPPQFVRAGKQGHLGLQVMHDRAKALGAKLTIDARRNEGTVVRVTLRARRAYGRGLFGLWRWRRAAGVAAEKAG